MWMWKNSGISSVTSSEQELKSLRSLSRNMDLTIKKADKGSCIVVEDMTNYIDIGLSHLQDASIYI